MIPTSVQNPNSTNKTENTHPKKNHTAIDLKKIIIILIIIIIIIIVSTTTTTMKPTEVISTITAITIIRVAETISQSHNNITEPLPMWFNRHDEQVA